MPIYRLEPIADRDDPIWLEGPMFRRIVVRAKTSGDARRVAANYEAELLGYTAETTAGNAAMDYPGAFMDEKLYRVVQVSDPQAEEAGDSEVLSVEGADFADKQ